MRSAVFSFLGGVMVANAAFMPTQAGYLGSATRQGSSRIQPALTGRMSAAALTVPTSTGQDASARVKWKGLLGLAGGSLIHLSCGSMYCWGNMLSYMPPHLKYWGGAAAAAVGRPPE